MAAQYRWLLRRRSTPFRSNTPPKQSLVSRNSQFLWILAKLPRYSGKCLNISLKSLTDTRHRDIAVGEGHVDLRHIVDILRCSRATHRGRWIAESKCLAQSRQHQEIFGCISQFLAQSGHLLEILRFMWSCTRHALQGAITNSRTGRRGATRLRNSLTIHTSTAVIRQMPASFRDTGICNAQ